MRIATQWQSAVDGGGWWPMVGNWTLGMLMGGGGWVVNNCGVGGGGGGGEFGWWILGATENSFCYKCHYFPVN